MDISKLKPDNAKAIAIILIVIVVLVLGAIWVSKTFGSIGSLLGKIGGAVEGVTDSLGITQPKAVTDAAAANVVANTSSAQSGSPWNPGTYVSAPSGSSLDPSDNGYGMSSTDIATQIWQGAGIFSTDGQSMLAAIKQCQTKAQVSYLCYIFNSMYSKDLFDWLGTQLTSNANTIVLSQMVTYVNSLPNN